MKKFLVDIHYSIIDTYCVEAKNEHEAKERARKLFSKEETPYSKYELEDYEFDITKI